MNPEWIGYLAAMLITLAYMPQAVKVLRERHTASISLGMYILATLGAVCWVWYGLLIENWPIILCNGLTFLSTFIILLMKIRLG